ncbi:MAG: NAD(P)/FAD-dependent oxidoreductase [Burkholderiaceae bacterium]|jgi:cation diffusion facilitator CzcD-associated flavoprotein CzcO
MNASIFPKASPCDDRSPPSVFDVIIIGAGFAGIGMAIALRKAGHESFLVLERSATVGGTWRDNTYPGCACDIPSFLYSYSFEPRANWSRLYPSQPEILNYLGECVAKYRLSVNIQFETEIVEASYCESEQDWSITAKTGKRYRSRFLVSAMGGLNRPSLPQIEGLERFQGATFHSSAWRHDLDLSGRRVAVVGTGASAIQIIPELAKKVESLRVYQRTPPWILPRADRAIGPWEKRIYETIPGALRLLRNRIYLRQEMLGLGFVRRTQILGRAETLGLRFLERSVPDAALRARLTPRYRMGCKRILISNDYFPALGRPNVELIDAPIVRFTKESIVTAEGERPTDVVVFATGFRATDLLSPLRILGRGGADLNSVWQAGAHAYLGMTVPCFPNLFLLVGPNTGLGHNSIVFMIEAQVRYVMSCLALASRKGARAIEVRQDVEADFNERLQKDMSRTIWATGCQSWYMDDRGKNVTLWPGFTFTYFFRTWRAKSADFRLSWKEGLPGANFNPAADYRTIRPND